MLKVAVFFGGDSVESDISVITGIGALLVNLLAVTDCLHPYGRAKTIRLYNHITIKLLKYFIYFFLCHFVIHQLIFYIINPDFRKENVS